MYICDVYKSSLRFYCQRFSNNSNPEFTDEEVLTVYLFCGYCQIRQGVSVIMVSKTSGLSDVLYTPKYAFRSI